MQSITVNYLALKPIFTQRELPIHFRVIQSLRQNESIWRINCLHNSVDLVNNQNRSKVMTEKVLYF
jgi:hypothetical protein